MAYQNSSEIDDNAYIDYNRSLILEAVKIADVEVKMTFPYACQPYTAEMKAMRRNGLLNLHSISSTEFKVGDLQILLKIFPKHRHTPLDLAAFEDKF